MKMNTYVNFAGTCAEAFRYYEQHLGGNAGMMMTHGQAPDQSPVTPEWKDLVLHAQITIGGTELMAADIPTAEPIRSAYLSMRTEYDGEAERIFAALSDGGQVFMPIQETFFATRFGQTRDRFGIKLDDHLRAADAAGLIRPGYARAARSPRKTSESSWALRIFWAAGGIGR